jgi:hypothetical protein
VTVVITNPCTETEIDTTQVFEQLTTSIEGEAVSLTFDVFPNSVSEQHTEFGPQVCGAQTYQLMAADGSTVPNILTIDSE